MPILKDFERRLEGLVEGFFAKAFRSGVQPVELAKRLLREMDANQTIGITDIWVPNHYVFTLSPFDREKFEQAEQALAGELRQLIPGEIPAVSGMEGLLHLIQKGKPTRTYTLGKDVVTIGRLSGCDIVIHDPGASRRHAEIRRDGNGYVITDLGSTNGTMVNEATITERNLEEGDRITIGRTVLEFRRR